MTNIENLLGRDNIQLNLENIEHGLKNSVVLVTGAAGSIGSEIVRQLIAFHVKQVILLDEAESRLCELETEILTQNNTADFKVVLGNVTNQTKLWKIFDEYAPSIVFHAAAYQNISFIEDFPYEAIHVNVGGTKLLADLSADFGVERFIFISSGKAMNPTSIMGASKRVGEIYIQSLSQTGKGSTRFITTRFGNVLGKNSRVIQLLKKQIEQGGPVTITNKNDTYYFMSMPEACQLVLEAGFMGKGGEIFVFDMDSPITIYDLAKKMISLSDYISNQDIEIITAGLKSEEKLYEEPPCNKEELLSTLNDKIMIEKAWKHDYSKINRQVTKLLETLDDSSRDQLIDQLMYIVPEYISMNTSYRNGKTK